MKVLALCSAEYEKWVRRAAGIVPLLSPPVSLNNLSPATLERHDLLYIKLYGMPGEPAWYNQCGEVVVDADLIAQADLTGTTVFVANCYLPESPMLDALMSAGMKAVIGGGGYNYFRRGRLEGVDLLGLYVRFLMQHGMSASSALWFGKLRLRFKRQDKVTRDTLSFQIWTGGKV